MLLNALEPYQREIEHHFALEGQRRFHGLMGGYLRLFTRARYVGSTLRDRIPLLPRAKGSEPAPSSWDLPTFTRACSEAAANRQLSAHGKALVNRLLVAGNEQGFPVDLLTEPVEAASRLDWRQCHARAVSDVLEQVERQWFTPTGFRRILHGSVVFLGNRLPPVTFVGTVIYLLWRLFYLGKDIYRWDLLLLPCVVLLTVLILMQIIIGLLLPLRWRNIRGEFAKRLEQRLRMELESTHLSIPTDVAAALVDERRRLDQLQKETREVAGWLHEREQAANITELYGKQ